MVSNVIILSDTTSIVRFFPLVIPSYLWQYTSYLSIYSLLGLFYLLRYIDEDMPRINSFRARFVYLDKLISATLPLSVAILPFCNSLDISSLVVLKE